MNNNNDQELIKKLLITDPSQAQLQSTIDFSKYFKLMWKKKHWIMLFTVLISVLWFFAISMFAIKPEYTSSAVIRFDDPRGGIAVTDFGVMDAISKRAVLNTRSFLGRVVDSLHYNIIYASEKINPATFVKSIEIVPEAKHGNYKILNHQTFLVVYFTNKEESIEDSVLKRIPIAADSCIIMAVNGLRLDFNPPQLLKYPQVEFSYIPKTYAVDILKENLTVNMDRSRTILTISYTDKNPGYAAVVINTVADLFVQQLVDYKRIQTSSILVSLQEQLQAAEREFTQAESQLREFREANPFVFLANDQQRMISQYADLEGDLEANTKNLTTLQELLNKLKHSGNGEQRSFIYQEILAFFQSIKVLGAELLIEEYEQLLSQQQRLLDQNFSPQHPQLVNLQNQIMDIEEQIDAKASQYYQQLQLQIGDSRTDINQIYRNLKNLPRNQLRLAELERNRQIKGNLVSTIMARIEEAKVSDAAVIPDAYVIDKAEPQRVKSNIMIKLKMLLAGPLLGLFLGMAFFIIIDLLDNSARSAREVEKKLKIPLLATIPVIGDLKEVPGNNPGEKKMDEKLITSDYAPNIAGESFRFLRTKLNLLTEDSHRSFIITSKDPGEGKSLIAANLAVTYAQQKLPTLLMDCDLRRGVLHHSFAINKEPGLSNLLQSDSRINVLEASRVINSTHVPYLFLMASGKNIPNPSELLGSTRMKDLVKILKGEFSVIIFDTPPLEFAPDALVIKSFVDHIILLTRYAKTNLNRLSDVLQNFNVVKKDVIGVLINASPEIKEKKYYTYSYYHY